MLLSWQLWPLLRHFLPDLKTTRSRQGQVKVRSRSGQGKKSNLKVHKCHKKFLSGAVWAQESDGSFYFVISIILWHLWLVYRGTNCKVIHFFIFQDEVFKTGLSWCVINIYSGLSRKPKFFEKKIQTFFENLSNSFIFFNKMQTRDSSSVALLISRHLVQRK